MINWEKTAKAYEYSSIEDLKGKKRPYVICECTGCGKEKHIQLRSKKEMTWTCPSCVSLSRSNIISERLKITWDDKEYRSNQLTKKNELSYKLKQSTLSKERWNNPSYRSKIATGINQDKLIQSSFEILYSTNWQTKMVVKCQKCGNIQTITPQKHFEHQYCTKCHISKGQREISEWLDTLNIKHNINDWSILETKELDIYIPDKKIAIEYHGLYWHSSNTRESKEEIVRHQAKAIQCMNKGIRLYQIYEHEWENQKDLIKSMIAYNILPQEKLNARSCIIIPLDQKTAREFFLANHVQGHRNSRYIYGLYHYNELTMAMSFNQIKPNEYEIMRLACKQGYIVRGGASKLLSHFEKSFPNTTIHTFADLRYSHGQVYKKLGFKEQSITSPGYFYYHPNSKVLLSRQKCQKHKLARLLNEYNPDVSESQNMFNNGFRIIWTAGNLKFIKCLYSQ